MGFIDTFKNVLKSIGSGDKNKEFSYEEERQALLDSINSSSGPAKASLPDVPAYDRIEYDAPGDGELEKRASGELNAYYNQNIEAIEKEMQELYKKYESEKAAAQKSAGYKEGAVKEAYESAKTDVYNDSLKRGLARSSIAVNKQSELSEAAAKAEAGIFAELSDRIYELDSQIADLGAKREKALSDFNIAYASKLTATINGLKEEREEKRIEALKYNNTLTEKEYEASTNKQVKESDLYSKQLSQAESENKLKDSIGAAAVESNYNKMRELLAKMSKSDAKNAVANDPVFKDNLNDYYFYKLYDEFCR